jgi:ATP-dependent RNA helicase DDX56/DBP9
VNDEPRASTSSNSTTSTEPNKKRKILDVEAGGTRGIDYQGVRTVVVFEFPSNTKKYLHRVGRTARMGAKGLAISFISFDEEEKFQKVCATFAVDNHNQPFLKMEFSRNKQLKEYVVDKSIVESFRYRCTEMFKKAHHSAIKLELERETAEEGIE